MARKIYRGYARDGNGTVLSGATVSVYLTGTSTVASIYAASSGGTAVNSTTTDSTGLYSFYVDYSDYAAGTQFRLTISKSGYDSVTYDEVECIPLLSSPTTRTVTAKTADYAVLAADMDKVFTNTGASGAVVFTLPEASTVIGESVYFVVTVAQNLDVNPADATDQILGLTNAAGDALRNATIGGVVGLMSVGDDAWVATTNYGTWADVN
jgi:hypothetical protein